jgi:DNA-binding HxlR family transcriptional regulator
VRDYLEGTVTVPRGPADRRAREVLERVGDKWSLLVIGLLREGPLRFAELRRSVDGISQRLLTVILRELARDGLVTRTVRPTVPPRVDYVLTPMGRTLLNTVRNFLEWADEHLPEIDARAADDRRTERPSIWPNPWSRAAGSLSWVGSSSAAGPLRTTAPTR